jgi:antitoxin Phd
MNINLNQIVSISEANQNFSKVARMVDENGAAVILKNNAPKYILLDFNKVEEDITADNKTIEELSYKIINKYREAFEELAK